MYCKHCGKEISDDSRFCRFCGKPLIGGTGETISAGGDAYKDVGIEGMGAMGRQVTQIQIQGMSVDQYKEISSQLSPAILIIPPPTSNCRDHSLKFLLSKRITSHNLIFDQTKYNPNQLIFKSNKQN